MKKIILAIFIILYCSTISYASNSTENGSIRDLKIKLLNHKGKPYRNAKSVMYMTSNRTPFLLEKDGTFTFSSIKPGDTLVIAFPNYLAVIPTQDMDSIELRVPKKLRKNYDREKTSIFDDGISKLNKENVLFPVSTFDARTIPNKSTFKNLSSLITGRFPGVYVDANGSVLIRGVGSVNSTQPLCVVDGVQMSLEDANRINLEDIKTIQILKDGGIYGARGANGVIVITTLDGKD